MVGGSNRIFMCSKFNMCQARYLSSSSIHYFFTNEVRLVSHQQPGDIFTGITVYLVQPLLHIVKGFLTKKSKRVNEAKWERRMKEVHVDGPFMLPFMC